MGEEIAGDAVVFGIVIVDAFDSAGRKGVNEGVWIGHKDGGVSGDDELGALLDEIVEAGEDGELATGGERGFGFVKEVKSLAVESVEDEGKEGFAVGLLVERPVAVGWTDVTGFGGFGIELFNFGGDVEEAFSAEEESVARFRVSFGDFEKTVEIGMRRASLKREIPRAALGVKTASDGKCFKERGFAGAVLADEKGDPGCSSMHSRCLTAGRENG